MIDSSLFQPPPGSRIAEGFSDAFSGPLRPAWLAATTVGGQAAGALGAWIKYSPFRHAATSDPGGIEAENIPRDEPRGRPDPTGSRYARVARHRAGHTVSEVRFAAPGIDQIDRRYQARRRPTTIACDGQRHWQVYADKITTGPAEPPRRDIGDLADPSWLLRCTLSGGAMVTGGDHSAFRISATRRTTGGDAATMLFPAAVAVIDAELGIILRLTFYIGDKPVHRYELRDVTTSVSDFRPQIPAGLPVIEQARFHA